MTFKNWIVFLGGIGGIGIFVAGAGGCGAGTGLYGQLAIDGNPPVQPTARITLTLAGYDFGVAQRYEEIEKVEITNIHDFPVRWSFSESAFDRVGEFTEMQVFAFLDTDGDGGAEYSGSENQLVPEDREFKSFSLLLKGVIMISAASD